MRCLVSPAEMPPPHPFVTVALIGLAATLWIFARVHLLRRQLERGDAQQRGVTQLGFLHHFAAWRGTYGVLAIVAAGCAFLLWWGLR